MVERPYLEFVGMLLVFSLVFTREKALCCLVIVPELDDKV